MHQSRHQDTHGNQRRSNLTDHSISPSEFDLSCSRNNGVGAGAVTSCVAHCNCCFSSTTHRTREDKRNDQVRKRKSLKMNQGKSKRTQTTLFERTPPADILSASYLAFCLAYILKHIPAFYLIFTLAFYRSLYLAFFHLAVYLPLCLTSHLAFCPAFHLE